MSETVVQMQRTPQEDRSDVPLAGEETNVTPKSATASQPSQLQAKGGFCFAIPDDLKERQSTPSLNKAVAEVLAKVEWVKKRGKNKFFNYEYATADDLREHVAKLLGEHGLSYEQHEIGLLTYGKMITVGYAFRLNHSSGEVGPLERLTAQARLINEKGSDDDKAISKAHMLALKDWAKSRFSIPTGEDSDPAGGDDPDRDDRQTAPPRPPAQRTPARGTASAPVSKTTTMQDVARETTQSHAVENHDYAEEAGDPGEPPPASTVIDPDEQWVDIELAMALRGVKTIKAYDEFSKAGTEVHTKMSGLYERNKPLFDKANGMFAAKRKELTSRIA